MLHIHIPDIEYYDSKTEEFGYFKAQDITLEHSLLSVSKWESRWHKPYLDDTKKTGEEAIDYIRCMTLTQNVNPDVYNYLPNDVINKIVEYMEDPMTATWFGTKTPGARQSRGFRRNREVLTSEVLYYYMIQLQIPFECQKWHLNRLLTLIRVCSEKNNPKKMGRQEQMAQQRLLNAQRRARLHTKG